MTTENKNHVHAMSDIRGLLKKLSDLVISGGGMIFGNTAGTACEGNDARLSDPRTPNTHGNEKHTSVFSTSTDITNSVNTHAAVAISVHGFDGQGNAPAQSHANERHSTAFATETELTTHENLTTSAHGGILAATAFSGLAHLSVSSVAPTSPAINDLWIQTT